MSAASVLCFIGFPQDVELLVPVARGLIGAGHIVTLLTTRQVLILYPWVRDLLSALGRPLRVVDYRLIVYGLWPPLGRYDALVTASESTARPHAVAHALARRANAAGLETYTLQHGLENVGLTYFGPPVPDIQFASRHVLTWGAVERLPPALPVETRSKCVAVGCPKATTQATTHENPRARGFVLVAENLHSERYDDNYRETFLAALLETADRLPDTRFGIRPHPAGRWVMRQSNARREIGTRGNIIVLGDPSMSAGSLLAHAPKVVATRSSVALDAARAGCDVAVHATEEQRDPYRPLPALWQTQDWVNFVSRPLDLGASRAFVGRALLPGDAVARIVSVVSLGRDRVGQV